MDITPRSRGEWLNSATYSFDLVYFRPQTMVNKSGAEYLESDEPNSSFLSLLSQEFVTVLEH